MRPGTRFFLYGMNALKILLQMPASTHGLTSLAETTGIWQNMLPVCLRIRGFNVCSPGILLALDVWAVHKTTGIQHLMRTADIRIWNVGEMRHWTPPYGFFFFSPRSFLAAEGPLTQGCCTGQPPGTDCFYTGQSPDVLVVGKV